MSSQSIIIAQYFAVMLNNDITPLLYGQVHTRNRDVEPVNHYLPVNTLTIRHNINLLTR
nr:MAG TPA: hypothetical protein [Inoviridae sp.]